MNVGFQALSFLFSRELASARRTQAMREEAFEAAQARAEESGKTLVVIGDPDAGLMTRFQRAYGCGDVCVDKDGCPNCPSSIEADVCEGVPEIADGSAVVYCSCVLEYVDDPLAAWDEMVRMAGGEGDVFLATVEPNSITSALYPGARWSIDADTEVRPVKRITQGIVAGTLLAATVAAVKGVTLL